LEIAATSENARNSLRRIDIFSMPAEHSKRRAAANSLIIHRRAYGNGQSRRTHRPDPDDARGDYAPATTSSLLAEPHVAAGDGLAHALGARRRALARGHAQLRVAGGARSRALRGREEWLAARRHADGAAAQLAAVAVGGLTALERLGLRVHRQARLRSRYAAVREAAVALRVAADLVRARGRTKRTGIAEDAARHVEGRDHRHVGRRGGRQIRDGAHVRRTEIVSVVRIAATDQASDDDEAER